MRPFDCKYSIQIFHGIVWLIEIPLPSDGYFPFGNPGAFVQAQIISIQVFVLYPSPAGKLLPTRFLLGYDIDEFGIIEFNQGAAISFDLLIDQWSRSALRGSTYNAESIFSTSSVFLRHETAYYMQRHILL